MWVDCGCPRAGVVFELRNRTKKEYKYSVRRAKRRRVHIANEKLGKALCCKNSKAFWSLVMSRKSKLTNQTYVIDGLSRDEEISCHFQGKLPSLLNQDDPSGMEEVSDVIHAAVSEVNLQESFIPVNVVTEALSTLG